MSSITERLAALLETTAPFSGLSPEQRTELISEASLNIYEPGEVIIPRGTDIHRALYLVESGLVRLYDEERNKLVNMIGEGGIFGTYGLIEGGVLPYSAKAIEPAVCALISADRFTELYKSDPDFKAYFDSDIKAYVTTLGADMDAGAAFLLFETSLRDIVTRKPCTVEPDTSIRDVAREMRALNSETAVVVQDGVALGVITEGDIVDSVVAADLSTTETTAGFLIERPPIALDASAKLFDAVLEMMKQGIRRIVVTDDKIEDGESSLLGIVTAEDVAHFRGLDPVASVERMQKAQSVKELAQLRLATTRRLLRLYQQGIRSEDLMEVVAELDDQMKRRLLHIIEAEVRTELGDPGVPWVWMALGAPGRREEALYTMQSNGLVYGDPENEEQAAQARKFFAAYATRAVAAMVECGIRPSPLGIIASNEPFRQPLSSWSAAYDAWIDADESESTRRAAICFDLRCIYGEVDLVNQLRRRIAERMAESPNRFLNILMRHATDMRPPLSFFGTFELERGEGETQGFNLRRRGLGPIVNLTRVLALEVGYMRSTTTFDRLRHLREAQPDLKREVDALLDTFVTMTDILLRSQMEAADSGESPTDFIDPNFLHKSGQNLLKQSFKKIDKVQSTLEKRFQTQS